MAYKSILLDSSNSIHPLFIGGRPAGANPLGHIQAELTNFSAPSKLYLPLMARLVTLLPVESIAVGL
jgi:hypothetical protein